MSCLSRERALLDWVSDSGRPACRHGARIAETLRSTSISVHTGDGPRRGFKGSLRLRSVERSSCRMACRLQDGMPMRTTRGIQDVVHNFASQFKCRRNASPAQSGPRPACGDRRTAAQHRGADHQETRQGAIGALPVRKPRQVAEPQRHRLDPQGGDVEISVDDGFLLQDGLGDARDSRHVCAPRWSAPP